MSSEPINGEQPDQRIGDRVRRMRERAKLSQDQTADAMRDAGFKWSNRTVWQVETGSRPLRLSEAEELTRALKGSGLRSVDQLLQTEAFRSIADEVGRFREATHDLKYALAAVHGSGESVERNIAKARSGSEDLDMRTREQIERAESALEDNHPLILVQRWVEIRAREHSKIDESLPRDLAQVIRQHSSSLAYLDPIKEKDLQKRLQERLKGTRRDMTDE